MANYVFETNMAANQTLRAVTNGGYVAQRFGTGHNVNSTTIYRVRMRVNTTGAASFKVAFYWGNGGTATLLSETTHNVGSATTNWFEHALATPITPANLTGKAFEVRIIGISGTTNVVYNNEGYQSTIPGGAMVSATTLTGAQSTVANGVSYFGLLERDPIYSGNQNASAFTAYSYSGTPISIGSQFTAPWAFNKFEAIVSGNGGTGVVSVDLYKGGTAGVGGTLVNTVSQTLTASGTTIVYVSVPLSATQVAGEYYYLVRPTNGGFRMYSDSTGAEARGLYYDGSVMYTSGNKWSHRLTKDQDYVAGPVIQRWTGSAWVTATIKRWNGSAWVTTTATRY